MDERRVVDDPKIKEIEQRLREVESQVAVHKSQIENLMHVDEEHSIKCPASILFDKVDNMQKSVSTTIGNVDLLKKFVIPLISLSNVVSLTFLLLLFNSISTQSKDLNLKLDRFIDRYNDAENLRIQYATEMRSYKEKVDRLEQELTILKQRGR